MILQWKEYKIDLSELHSFIKTIPGTDGIVADTTQCEIIELQELSQEARDLIQNFYDEMEPYGTP